VPPKLGEVQFVESVNNHCCITVDLDLIGGYAKFFRNGHLLGQAFTGLTAPISPALAFLQVRFRTVLLHRAYFVVPVTCTADRCFYCWCHHVLAHLINTTTGLLAAALVGNER
jgi:hypothetical protein